MALGEAARVPVRAAPHPHAAQAAHRPHGLEMGASLNPRAQDREVACVLAREQPRRHAAHGGGAYGGDRARVDDRQGAAVPDVEQHHRALMRVVLGPVVAREDGHHLEPERARRSQIAGHQPEEPASIRQPHHGAERLDGVVAGERGQRPRHHLDALPHRQQLLDFRIGDDSSRHRLLPERTSRPDGTPTGDAPDRRSRPRRWRRPWRRAAPPTFRP